MLRKSCYLIVFGCVVLGGPLASQEIPRRSPHNGDLFQTLNYADSYFNWLNVGGWVGKNGSIPGFELDYAVENVYYTLCTSYTNLPQGYDDCVTAGFDEDDPNEISFGVGSYDARQIQAGTGYFAQWSLGGGSQQASTYSVNWQEVWNFVNLGYGPQSPWYMDGVAGGVLTSYVTSKTVDQTRNWKWRDRSLSGTGAANQEPDGTYYYSSTSQRHTGTLIGPAGTNFNLYLYYWNGSAWQIVESSTGPSSGETINYAGSPGYYAWIVQSYSGSGRYQFGIEYGQ